MFLQSLIENEAGSITCKKVKVTVSYQKNKLQHISVIETHYVVIVLLPINSGKQTEEAC